MLNKCSSNAFPLFLFKDCLYKNNFTSVAEAMRSCFIPPLSQDPPVSAQLYSIQQADNYSLYELESCLFFTPTHETRLLFKMFKFFFMKCYAYLS